MALAPDSLVLLLLCSHLALDVEDGLASLTLREWNQLARRIQSSSYERPQGILGETVDAIQTRLDLPQAQAERLVKLLARASNLEADLRRLESVGIGAITRADADYPQRYRQRLKESAPPILFFAGEYALLGQPGIAVVGSRHLDQAGQECAVFVGNACGLSGLVLYSGGAKGVDRLSMNAALDSRGTAVGILADSLERAIRDADVKDAIRRGDLCLATPYAPNAGFSVGAAMGRNRLIYCLADYAIVVASDAERGGTWAGATEALKAGWLPVFILDHPAMPDGNRLLMQKGGVVFPHPFPESPTRLADWLSEHSLPPNQQATQLGLF